MNLLQAIVDFQDEIIAIRRDIHAHPELGYQEVRTADLIATHLAQWGIPVHRGLAATGLVGEITGQVQNGRAIGLRADMDGLPMTEQNTFAHASQSSGRMHACGHDGHVAMLLAAARYLAAHRDFAGTVYLIFQPGEEGYAGARRMMREGLFERFPVEAVFAMHNMPGMAVGDFGVIDGPVMASSGNFTVTATGRGTHAAKPHTGRDPIMALVQLAQSFQTIVSRQTDPLQAIVLSITQLQAGTANNVIPDTATMKGTLRTLSAAVKSNALESMARMTRQICDAMGCEGEFTFDDKYPATLNHPKEAAFCAEVLSDIVGDAHVDRTMKPDMGGEDFAFMLQQCPGCYVRIGNGDGSHRPAGHGTGPCELHGTSFDFNDALIAIGGTFWVRLAERWLAANPQ